MPRRSSAGTPTRCSASACWPNGTRSRPTRRKASSPTGRSRHPDRSAKRAVEGPALVDATTEQVPPLRLATLGSGRDDELFGVRVLEVAVARALHDGLRALELELGIVAFAERAVAVARQEMADLAQPHRLVGLGV